MEVVTGTEAWSEDTGCGTGNGDRQYDGLEAERGVLGRGTVQKQSTWNRLYHKRCPIK